MPEDPHVSPESQGSESSESSKTKSVADSAESATSTPPSSKPPVSVRVELSQTDKVLGQVSTTAKKFWKSAQPVFKEKSIQALRVSNRFTNQFLDHTWPKLSGQAIAAVPAQTKAKVEAQKAKVQPTLNKLQPIWEKGVVPVWQKVVVPLWMKGIAFLKSRLPEPLAQELTDRFLTIAVISVLVVAYWFLSSLTGGKPVAAKQPAFSKPTAAPIITRRPVATPAQPLPKSAPSLATKPIPKPLIPKPIPPAAKPLSPSEPVAIPTQIPAKAPSAPIATAKPALDLAEIQTQLSGAVANVDPALIASVRSLESNHRLQAMLGETWFGLSVPAQNQVAQTLWEKSQALKFETFELRDDAGDLVARSPAVGSKVIILKRKDSSSPG
jgi:hypothetical protein